MEGKSKAKAEMLKSLSKEMSNDSNEGLKDILGKKNGIKKVTVSSNSPEGLKKGLSMAEKIMEAKAKSKGEMPMEAMDDAMEEDEEEAPAESSDADEKAAAMSDEEAQEMYEALKKRCE
jgi:hypothetical protein